MKKISSNSKGCAQSTSPISDFNLKSSITYDFGKYSDSRHTEIAFPIVE